VSAATKPGQDQHIAGARRRLVHLAALEAKTAETERAILTAAEHRQDQVLAELDQLRPRALADGRAGDRYLELTEERGKLAQVIAKARQALA